MDDRPSHRQPVKDYRLKITVSNNRLLERIERQGFDGVKSFCRKHKLSVQGVYNCAALKIPLLKKDGQFRSMWVRLAEILNCEVPDLIPAAHWETALPRRTAVVTMDQVDVEALLPPKRELLPDEARFSTELRYYVATWFAELPERYIRVIYGRFGFDGAEKTCEELGEELGVTQQRIRQIEARALLKLSRKARQAFPENGLEGLPIFQKGLKGDVVENLEAR